MGVTCPFFLKGDVMIDSTNQRRKPHVRSQSLFVPWNDLASLTLEKMSHANLMRDHPLHFPSPMASNSLEFPKLRMWLSAKVSQSIRS